MEEECVCDDGFKGINCGATKSNGLSTTEKVGIGLGAGALTAIVVAAIAGVGAFVGGGYGLYKYKHLGGSLSSNVISNPLYQSDEVGGENPLYETPVDQ